MFSAHLWQSLPELILSLWPHMKPCLENLSQCDMFKNYDILEWLFPNQGYIPLQGKVSLLQEVSESLEAPLQLLLIFYHTIRGMECCFKSTVDHSDRRKKLQISLRRWACDVNGLSGTDPDIDWESMTQDREYSKSDRLKTCSGKQCGMVDSVVHYQAQPGIWLTPNRSVHLQEERIVKMYYCITKGQLKLEPDHTGIEKATVAPCQNIQMKVWPFEKSISMLVKWNINGLKKADIRSTREWFLLLVGNGIE